MIFKYAFQPQAIIGGSFGYALKTAISQGAKRGLFSNEAGMGSTPHAHAQANVKHAHDQGVVAMIGVFIDTFVVLTLNALVIICTLYTKDGILATGVVPEGIGKTNLAQTAFGSVFGAGLRRQVCGGLPVLLRLLHHPQLEPVRQDQRRLPVRQKERQAVQRDLHHHRAGVHLPGHRLRQRLRVGSSPTCSTTSWCMPNVIALFALTGMVVASLNEMKKNKLKV